MVAASNARKAVLIGVPEYRAKDDLPTIPTVTNDLRQLEVVLRSTGYDDVTTLPDVGPNAPEPSEPVSRPEILHALKQACRQAPEDGVLFVYLSGHGVSVDDCDHLVPWEIVSLDDALEDTSQLVPVDLAPFLGECRARTVILAVDACREISDAKGGVSLSTGQEFGRGALAAEHRTRVTTVFGCDQGQFCYYSESLGMSLFTKALCTVLAPDHRAQTLRDVVDAADEVLAGLVARHKPHRTQQIALRHESGAGPGRDDVICAGSADPWRAAVSGSALWSRVGPPAAELDAHRDALAAAASTAWSWWQDYVDLVPDDPWRDPQYVPRCLAALGLLVPDGTVLHPPEVTALLAAPLLAEIVHSAGLLGLMTSDPLALLDPGEPDRAPEAEAVHAAHPRLRERATALAEEHTADALGIATWLAHRFVFRQVGLWREKLVGDVSRAVAEVVETRRGFQGELAAALRALATFMTTQSEELDAFLDSADEARRTAAVDRAVAWRDGDRAALRTPTLAVLVALAGSIGLDMRRIGEVAVQHLGPRDGLDLAELRLALTEASWTIDDRGTLALEARCSHPAIDLALRENAAAVHALLTVARRRVGSPLAGALVDGLPLAAAAEGVAPEVDGRGRDVYETPLLQFRLAHDEIRDLLMGARLYGDPALAVRELYQNALDACRYRKLRARYLEQPYQGEILIRQGTDDDGREFIECLDNGVGMSRSDIERSFSRAGRRFVTSTAFLWEQAEWLRKDPELRLWPNSRFGIGVFSYFMIAEEVLVETAVVGQGTNTPGSALHVRIASSGSLFRIVAGDPAGDVARSGGTRVRLYLHQQGKAVSSRRTLVELLWYSEFDVRCAEDGAADAAWEAGTLAPTRAWACPAGPDTWWTGAEGALLVDGIWVDERPFGFVANLRGAHAPTLTVDRKNLESWDEAAVRTSLISAASAPREDGDPDFVWLVTLAQTSAVVAQAVFEDYVRHGAGIPLQAGSRRPTGGVSLRIDLGRTGVSSLDVALVEETRTRIPASDMSWSVDGPALQRARVAVLHRAAVLVSSPENPQVVAAPFETLDGHSRPEPVDVVLLDRSTRRRMRASGQCERLVRTSTESGLTIAHLTDRLRRYVLYGAVPPPATADESDDRVADAADIALWKANRSWDGRRPFVSTLVEASRDHGVPLLTLRRRIERLVVVEGPSDFPAVVDPDYVATDADVELFTSLTWRRVHVGAVVDVRRRLVLALARAGRPEAFRGLVTALGLSDAVVDVARELVDRTPRARAMSRNGDGAEPYLAGEASPLDLLLAAHVLRIPPDEVHSALAAFAGVMTTSFPPAGELPARALTEREAAVLGIVARCERALLRDGLAAQGLLPDQVYAQTASELGLAARVVWETLAPFLPSLGMVTSVDGAELSVVPPSDAEKAQIASVIGPDGTQRPGDRTPRLAPVVPPGERDAFLRRWGLAQPFNLMDYSVLADGAIQHPSGQDVVPVSVERMASLSVVDRTVLSADLTGDSPFVTGRITLMHVVRAAQRTRQSMAAVVARLTTLASDFPLVLPGAGEIDWPDLDVVLGNVLLGSPFGTDMADRLSSTDVVLLAAVGRRSCARTLAQVRMLLTDEDAQSARDAPDVVPTSEDAAAILLGRHSSIPVGPLGDLRRVRVLVIRTAAYHGWPVSRVCDSHARLAPFLPYDPPACPPGLVEYVPDWRDVVLVTRGLDGVHPLTDDVLAEGWFVPRAARALELTEDDVVTRLRLLADFVGFTPP